MAIPLRERWEEGRGWEGGNEERGLSEDFLGGCVNFTHFCEGMKEVEEKKEQDKGREKERVTKLSFATIDKQQSMVLFHIICHRLQKKQHA